MPQSYSLLNHMYTGDEVDLIVAGDGVYRLIPCFGIRIPYPLVHCEIRGLLPLSSPLFPGDFAPDAFERGTGGIPLPFAPSYHMLTNPQLPPLDASRIYQYVFAGNGVFLFAGCPGIEVLMPISVACYLPELVEVLPHVTWKHPLVGAEVVQELFDRARAARDAEHGHMLERLFYLTWEGEWRIHEPEQNAAPTFVKAISSTEEDEMALIEGHSHHDMPAYFSATDNRDELENGCMKICFVLGYVHLRPQIRARICVHGYSWDVPARTFFALPAGVEDCVVGEWMGKTR